MMIMVVYWGKIWGSDNQGHVLYAHAAEDVLFRVQGEKIKRGITIAAEKTNGVGFVGFYVVSLTLHFMYRALT